MRTITSMLAAGAICFALDCPAAAQAMFTASAGNVFGGDAPSKKSTWAVAIGGGGAHGIGSELEYSEARNFFETADGVAYGKVSTLMPGIFVMVPVGKVRPYGIVGFGFIRRRVDASVGGVSTDPAENDTGYSVGAGVTFQFARSAGVRADLRRFKVRKADGITFQRFLIGIVLGG